MFCNNLLPRVSLRQCYLVAELFSTVGNCCSLYFKQSLTRRVYNCLETERGVCLINEHFRILIRSTISY
jgi:hypothetical protein